MNVCLSEEKVLRVWEPLLDVAENWGDTIEIDVIELHCVHICSFPGIPWSVYEAERSLPIYIETPTTYLYKEISS
jgi:hypothetical protein